MVRLARDDTGRGLTRPVLPPLPLQQRESVEVEPHPEPEDLGRLEQKRKRAIASRMQFSTVWLSKLFIEIMLPIYTVTVLIFSHVQYPRAQAVAQHLEYL